MQCLTFSSALQNLLISGHMVSDVLVDKSNVQWTRRKPRVSPSSLPLLVLSKRERYSENNVDACFTVCFIYLRKQSQVYTGVSL